MQTELFCPLDGKKLIKAKWETHYNSQWRTLICPDNHLWDISEHSYMGGLEFQQVKLSKCECGEVMPSRDMKDIQGKKTCPACFEIAKKAWRMDKSKSYARLEISPVRTTDGVIYLTHTSIEISPYPNPFSYGGMYGGGSAKDEPELQEAIKGFEAEVARLKENGMEKVEIIRHDEITRQEQPKLVALVSAKLQPKDFGKPEPIKPKQLALV